MIGLLLLAAAVQAPQTGPVEHLKKRVVDAIRNCPEAQAGEVVVCAPDRGIAEGYRLPKLDRRFAGAGLKPNGRTVDPSLAATGTGSCSRVGAGGAIGCAKKDYGDWKADRERKRAADNDYLDPQ
jgi:hypothetical protein